jgi:Right handed beta helix region
MQDSSSLLIYSNEIIDGQIDLNNANAQTSAIEIAHPNQHVTITNNEIANNLGPGIGADSGTKGTNFRITDTRFTTTRTLKGSLVQGFRNLVIVSLRSKVNDVVLRSAGGELSAFSQASSRVR